MCQKSMGKIERIQKKKKKRETWCKIRATVYITSNNKKGRRKILRKDFLKDF